MARNLRSLVAPDPHTVRLVQQVAPGTPGAFVDAVFGRSWIATPRKGPRQGLNGRGGFTQIQSTLVLNDTSEIAVQLPPEGSDGRNNRDRLYFYSDTPDPQNPGQAVGYMAGDEWLEVYRGADELVGNGTPVSEQSAPEQLVLTCRDCVQPLQKSIETGAGFWNHAPRDVFEHYTRVQRCVIASNFPNQMANFPVTAATPNTSIDGRWTYQSIFAAASGPLTMGAGGASSSTAIISPVVTIPDAGLADHSCWRVETSISSLISTGSPIIELALSAVTGGLRLCHLKIDSLAGQVEVSTLQWNGAGLADIWASTTAGLVDSTNHLSAPYTLAIEARERYLYFYVNAQLVSIAQRPYPNGDSASTAADTLTASLILREGSPPQSSAMRVDYFVVRRTSPAMNGGTPGDYILPSPGDPGGLSGEFYDLTAAVSAGLVPIGSPTFTPAASRFDQGVSFVNPASGLPGWFPAALGASLFAFIRWTGSIYLPLATQDVHFALPAGGSHDGSALWVGKTRKGESVCAQGTGIGVLQNPAFGEPPVATSVGMRSLFGNVSGWYPLVFEYMWTAFNTGADTVGFTYDVGGAGSVPPPTVLSPQGCVTQQITGAHYDAIKTLSEQFGFQWRSQPRALESGSFPGVIIPKVRVGRDTDYILGESEAFNAQSTMTAEDGATTVQGQAQGLGGSSTGQLTAEAFNFAEMASHPFVSTETENLPGVTDMGMLDLQLESLLAFRSEPWEQVQASTAGQRQKRDTFPLTGVLAEFDWQPGDAIRRRLPQIGVVDTTPLPIQQLVRLLYPDGMGENQAAFRQRPRDFRRTMLRFIRQVYQERRTFQGQLALVDGTHVTTGYSQIILPEDLSLIRQAWLVVTQKSDASAWTVYVNGNATAVTITGPGRIDISNYIARNNSVEPRMLAGIVAGTGTATYALQMRVFIAQS